jgi:high-affinity Fe2+/Pb2+ permease
MDGQPLVPRLEGTALSIDPGEHQFVFSAQNVAPVQKSLIIREGEKGRREKIILGAELTAPNQVAAAQTIQTPAPVEQADETHDSSQQTKRIVGIAVGSAGLVSLGIALFEQITALDRDSQSKDAAASDEPGAQEDAEILHDQAKQAQTYAIIFGSAGAVAFGAGLYLLLSSLGGDEPSNPPAVGLYVVPSGEWAAAGVTYARTF